MLKRASTLGSFFKITFDGVKLKCVGVLKTTLIRFPQYFNFLRCSSIC